MNIFLTGQIQVGKSTAIRRFIEEYKIPVSGFWTRLDRESFTLTMTILDTGAQQGALDKAAILEVASRSPDTGFPAPNLTEFDRAGSVLRQIDLSACPLFIMDELGYMEKDALEFRASVENILRSHTPVLGVLRNRPDGPFWRLLHEIDDTVIITVDEGNRDQIPIQIAKLLDL